MPEWTGEHAPLTDAPQPDPAAEPESLVVRVDTGEQIHYLDWGAGEWTGTDPASGAGTLDARPGTDAGTDVNALAGDLPPLVLVHGLSQTAWSWAPVARRLIRETRVLAIDLRGHGLSDAPRSGYELDSQAIDLLTVLSANGWGAAVGGPPAVLAGHGLGAQVAATAASLQPESVAGVALVDGGWEDVGEATRLSATEYLAAIAEPPEVLASMEAFLADRAGYDPPSWDADQERAARAQVDQKHAGHVALVTKPSTLRLLVEATWAYRPADVIPGVTSPLLVVVSEPGGPDDEDLRERRLALDDVLRAREAAGAAPARVIRLPAGHNLMRYRPTELAAELRCLLQVAARGRTG